MEDKNEYTPDLYTLIDEEGVEQTFEMLDAIEIDDNEYFALVPYSANPDELVESDGDLVILKAVMDGEEKTLISIDDDDKFDKIGAIFLKRIEEMFDEEDCGCDCDEDCECGDNCSCH